MSQTETPDSITNQISSPEGCPDRPVICPRHCDQNVIHIPQSFSESFLWHSTDASLVVPSKQIFSDELVAEALALVSYGFACADGVVALASEGKKEPPERSITFYCPEKGNNVALDSMVKHVAAHHKADVLILDALELAAGEFGALGKSSDVIDLVYKEAAKVEIQKSNPEQSEAQESKPEQESAGKDFDIQRVQAFFDALVTIPSKCSHKSDQQEGAPTAIRPSRRIIYLRDFGTIACAAKPLMTYILQAMHNSRNQCCSEGVAWAPLLVMGVTKPMVLTGAQDDDDDDDPISRFSPFGRRNHGCPHSRQPRALRVDGYKLRQIIPRLGSEYPTSNDEPPTILFNGLSAQLFLPLAVRSGHLRYCALKVDPSWSTRLDDLATCAVFLGIVTKDSHSETACRDRELDIQERKQAINDTLIRMCLGRRGGLIEEIASRKIFVKESENDNFQILSPSAADSIAVITMGLSYSDSDWSEPVLVTHANVTKGYETFLDAQQCRASWTASDEQDETTVREDPIVKKVKQSPLSPHESRLLRCVVDAASLTTTFDDVCVDPQITEMLRTVVSLPILYPDHFQSGILAKESIMGVLLYGPPGTGKTMLCRALAHQCGARMIAVKPSNILDMYVGESDKNASAVFSLAHRLAPCVVFIDEVDALFGARSSGSNRDKIHRDILTEFMQAMDGLQSAGINKKKGIVVIGATNRPFDIDQAILRRLPCRVLVDLPDEIQRKNILEGLLKDETCDADLVKIAKDTDGYSGSDLKNLCVSAAMASVKDAIDNFTWNKSSKDTVHPTPTNGDVASRNRTITMTHFSHALSEVVPSFSKNTSEELSRWHRMYSTIPNVMPRGVNNYHHNRANGNAQSRWALS